MKDIEETKSGKVGSGVLNVGLPAYVILNALLRSAKANSVGLVLSKYTRGNDPLCMGVMTYYLRPIKSAIF